MRSPARRRDVPTPVIGKLSLSHLGIVAVRVEPRVEEAGRGDAASVLETSLKRGVTLSGVRERGGEGGEGDSSDRDVERDVRVRGAETVPGGDEDGVRRDARDAPGRRRRGGHRGVSVSGEGEEMEILRSMIPKLVTDAFREVEGWCAFGSRRTRRGSCIRILARRADAIVTASASRSNAEFRSWAPQALDRDIGEDCEIELMFPSINAVVYGYTIRFHHRRHARRRRVQRKNARVCAREQRHRYLIHADNGSGGS